VGLNGVRPPPPGPGGPRPGGPKGVKQRLAVGTYDTLLSPVMVAWNYYRRGVASESSDQPRLKLHEGLHEARRHWSAGIEHVSGDEQRGRFAWRELSLGLNSGNELVKEALLRSRPFAQVNVGNMKQRRHVPQPAYRPRAGSACCARPRKALSVIAGLRSKWVLKAIETVLRVCNRVTGVDERRIVGVHGARGCISRSKRC